MMYHEHCMTHLWNEDKISPNDVRNSEIREKWHFSTDFKRHYAVSGVSGKKVYLSILIMNMMKIGGVQRQNSQIISSLMCTGIMSSLRYKSIIKVSRMKESKTAWHVKRKMWSNSIGRDKIFSEPMKNLRGLFRIYGHIIELQFQNREC